MSGRRHDVVVLGAGHNGLVAATMLARAGRSVLVLERGEDPGGATVSQRVFPGVDARLSRYSYLVSLFPRALAAQLGLDLRLAERSVASCTPAGDRTILVRADGAPAGAERAWQDFYAMTGAVAQRLFPTMTRPLPSALQARALFGDEAWEALVQRPLGETIEARFADDAVRGIVLTDALIGTFASAHDAQLRQNRCFLYHVVGNGTGHWDVPVGGMGAVRDALVRAARATGAEIRTGTEVVGVDADAGGAVVRTADGAGHDAGAVVATVAPAVLDRLLGRTPAGPPPEGAQLKVNMLVRRLPRLRDASVDPAEAFAGTFHVHEGYAELEAAHRAAASGRLPELLPCETYCHSLSDPSILGPELRAAGAHTLTLFSLHTPASLFRADNEGMRERATAAALRAMDDVLGEPLAELLWRDADGRPCLEARTPLDLEDELALPGGNIFHRDLQWPWAEDEDEAGRWGVETDVPSIVLGGAGARRGGGVSGIPGHNAAMSVLGRTSD